ncbi:TetR/AcrR family transcriptional regulator [Devosia sp. BK]|uniref:TetR/AcrR family transcriptional regulator n=1 Tax=unclassified Devosia TaxID=196773 RepID=UPI000712CFA0|nr:MULTISPECIES: TetR/AcrR family transcriptional regulator [unclassified Devosia]KQT47997.1 TetR family transcriptional regulator [Devosia sp. Leaf420]MDV3252087.1 TetR/AcrR family transcriptional regulator [Devosia sp. BK]
MTSTAEPDENTRRSIGARRNPASQEAILDAAQEILNEEGIAGFSIEAVARRARAGKPTIYRWWPNRTLLMLDVYQRFKNARGFPDTGSVRGDLISLLENHLLGFWKDSLCGTVYRAIIAEAQNDADAAAALFAYQTERKKTTAVIIERAKARGELAPEVNGELIIDMIISFAWHQLLINRLEEAMGSIEGVVDGMLMGCAGYNPA